jgi:hypothetical protein
VRSATPRRLDQRGRHRRPAHPGEEISEPGRAEAGQRLHELVMGRDAAEVRDRIPGTGEQFEGEPGVVGRHDQHRAAGEQDRVGEQVQPGHVPDR